MPDKLFNDTSNQREYAFKKEEDKSFKRQFKLAVGIEQEEQKPLENFSKFTLIDRNNNDRLVSVPSKIFMFSLNGSDNKDFPEDMLRAKTKKFIHDHVITNNRKFLTWVYSAPNNSKYSRPAAATFEHASQEDLNYGALYTFDPSEDEEEGEW